MGSKKLTREEVEKRLPPTIKMIGEYKDTTIKTTFRCLVDGYEWKTTTSSILSGIGCHKCAVRNRTQTREEIDRKLKERNIVIIGDYKTTKIKTKLRCLVEGCGYEWISKVGHIFEGNGCARCAKHEIVTNAIVDKRLEGRNIQRLEDVKGSKYKMRFRCLVDGCGYEWSSQLGSILAGRGCHRCNGYERLTNAVVDERLEGRSIQRLGDVKDSKTPIGWRCLVEGCGYEWKSRPNSILVGRSGCPRCNGAEKLTNERVDKCLEGRNIQRLEDIKGSVTPIRWRCLVDGHEWEAPPLRIFYLKCGCPKCSNSKGEMLVGKILTNIGIPYEIEKKFDTCRSVLPLPFDFFIPSINLLIEYQGEQHYRPVKWNKLMTDEEAESIYEGVVARDKIKAEWAPKHGYQLLILDFDMTEEGVEATITSTIRRLKSNPSSYSS